MTGLLRKAGIKVVTDGEKVRREYEKSLPIAVVRQYSKELPPRDIGLDPASYAAKLQKISERLNAIAEKRADSTNWHGVISELAEALGAKGGASKYIDIRIDDNHSVSLRISNHNANADNFANHGQMTGNISIVFKSRKSSNRFQVNEEVELTEYVYTHEAIKQDGNILSGVAKSMAQMLATGEYVDLTGKALVNRSPSALQAMTMSHGSAAAKEREVEFFKTRQGEVYGFVKDGVVYLDPDVMNPNTPLHEYTHLWARAARVATPTTHMDNLRKAEEMERKFEAKKARIEKLRRSEVVEITGEEYQGKYELNRESAQQWIKGNLRGDYINTDTGEKIELRKDGAQKVTSHSMGNEAHLKSIAVIPKLIERSIFIDELPNEKDNGKYDSYRYYVCGLNIGGEDYTVKVTIGIKGKNKYYDHSLTQIEKGSLIDNIDALSPTFDAEKTSSASVGKDTKLLSILQVDEQRIAKKVKLATGWERGADGKWRYEEPDEEAVIKGLERLVKGGKFPEGGVRLGELLGEGTEILAAYPEMSQITVVFDREGLDGGGYNPENGTITLRTYMAERQPDGKDGYLADVGNTLVHELQHAVQHIEGFASGGNLNISKRIAREKIEQIEQRIAHVRAQAREGKMDRESAVAEVVKLNKERARLENEYDVYKRLAGEVEARNVSRRMDMGAGERRESLAEETEDVPRDGQILLREGGTKPNSNIISGVEALQRLANGEEIVEDAMGRDDLSKYEDTPSIAFEWGKAGNPEKGYKSSYGISHILSKHGIDTITHIIDVIANGEIIRHVKGNKTVIISKDGYEAYWL